MEKLELKKVEALNLARKIAIFNSEVIYYVKHSLLLMSEEILKNLNNEREKFFIIIKSNYNNVDPDLLLATTKNNKNHDLLKIDVDLIYDILMEMKDESSN
jgi:hypothetical protein